MNFGVSVGGRLPTANNNLEVWCGMNGREDLLEEWAHPDKAPHHFMRGSGVKVPWTCGECGHGWEATVCSRTRIDRPTGCPKCNRVGGRRGSLMAK